MILALLLIGVAGALTAGWVALVIARSENVNAMTFAVQRRVALENSKALAQEFMLEKVMPNATGIARNYDLGDWGGIQVQAWAEAPLLKTTLAAGVNHFNPGNGDSYVLAVSVTLKDTTAARTYFLKSWSPLLAGNLLSIQTPTLTPNASLAVGSFDVDGGAFIWQPNLSMTCTPDFYAIPSREGSAPSFTNSAGAVLKMTNLALPRQIANPRNGGGEFYAGQFDAISNSNPAANSSAVKALTGFTLDGSKVYPDPDTNEPEGITSDGDGHVTISLSEQDRDIYIQGKILTLTLAGQGAANDAPAAARPALLIVVDQPVIASSNPSDATTRDLTSVTFTGHNSRRLDLAIKKGGGTVSSINGVFQTSSASWRLLLEVENCPIAFTVAGTAIVQGGFRSDRSLTLSSGSLRLTLEPDPKNLARLATRTAWVESYVP
jgi:hypothetical protein